MRQRAAGLLLLLGVLAAPPLRAAPPAPECVRRYADAFVALNGLASERRLKVETAAAEVAALFQQRPSRCEPGAYEYFLDQLVLFTKRALRSGATPQSPKEGWVRAATAACAYAPLAVPTSEHPADLARFQAALRDLTPLINEAAGGSAAPTELLAALSAAAPATADSPASRPPVEPRPPAVEPAAGTPTALVLPATPVTEEPPPAPLAAEPPPAPLQQAPAPGLADTYLARAAEFFQQGKYDQAANELQKAYLIRPKPIYLFNIAQAYRRGGRARESLALYHDFLKRDPQTPLLAETKGYIADMEKLLAEREQTDQARRLLATEKGRSAQQEKDLLETRRRAERAERERRRPVYKKGWFWGVLVTSVAAVGAGVALTAVYAREPATDGGIINLSF